MGSLMLSPPPEAPKVATLGCLLFFLCRCELPFSVDAVPKGGVRRAVSSWWRVSRGERLLLTRSLLDVWCGHRNGRLGLLALHAPIGSVALTSTSCHHQAR